MITRRMATAVLCIVCLAAMRGVAEVRKDETLGEIFARKLTYTRSSPFYKELHTPHLKRFLPRPWTLNSGEILIDENWSLEAHGMAEDPGPFAVEELKTFFLDTAGVRLKEDDASRRIVLRVNGTAKSRIEADSYTLNIAPNRIEINSPSPRGVLYGVYYLEQLMLERGIPAVKPMSVRRQPAFDIRMFGEVFGTFTISGLRMDRPVSRDTYSALSRFGANATFTFVQLGDYLGSDVYPELANPDREKNLAELSRLAKMAKSVGVDLYLDAYNPKLPGDHPVFVAHPESKGASQHGADIHCLCPSDPKALRYIADSWADVFRRVPELGGMVAIIGGEGFYHCYMRTGGRTTDCPRCKNRTPEDVVADLTNAVFHAIRAVKPDAELLAWPYSAFIWSKEPYQLDLISKLDPAIQFVSEIDKDHIYHKDGYDKNIWDYSIDFLGPSDRYVAQREAIVSRGAKQCCKTETATAWEHTGVPYIPCMQRWGRRMEIIRSQKPESIYYAYDCTGFTRSRPEELAGRLSWLPNDGALGEIKKIAERDFGPAAPKVMAAWDLFSEAIGHIPYLTHGYYKGPSFIGPGQPLVLRNENMPDEMLGRFFYLAENDLSEGSSCASMLRPIYTEDWNESPAGMADMEKALALWEEGVRVLRSAEVTDPYRREYQRELDMAAYLEACFRSVVHMNQFFALRRQEMTPDVRSEMRRIVEAELVNARRALPIVRRNPSLDLAVRMDMDYPPLVKVIEAKIKVTEATLRDLR